MGKERRDRIKRHVIKRAMERYGVKLTLLDIGTMNVDIRAGRFKLIERKTRRRRKYFVTTPCGVEIPVAYDETINCIRTVLPADAKEVQRALVKRPTHRSPDTTDEPDDLENGNHGF